MNFPRFTTGIFILISFLGVPFVQAQSSSLEEILQKEVISASDLGIKEPTLLPSSPFYFLKQWGRGLQKAFTFDPLRKLELELRFTDEKAIEVKTLVEQSPKNERAIERALEHYLASQRQLRNGLTTLSDTSKNPRVNELVEKVIERTVKHEKLLGEVKERVTSETEKILERVKENVQDTSLLVFQKEGAEIFVQKLEKALVQSEGSELKHLRSLEILDRLHEKAPYALKEKLNEVREEFSLRAVKGIEQFAKTYNTELLKEALEKLPGEKVRRIVIIEELKTQSKEELSEILTKTGEELEKQVEKRKELEEHTIKTLNRARELVQELEIKMSEISPVPRSVQTLFNEARAHLEKAADALAEKKVGEAFGLARSSEVSARNALRLLEEESPEADEVKEDISDFEKELREWEKKISTLPSQSQEEIRPLIDEIRFHLRLAADQWQKGDFKGAKKHLDEAENLLPKLERQFDEISKRPPPPPLQEVICTQEYKPVCGVDGRTYGNRCVAEGQSKVEVAYEGECKKPNPLSPSPSAVCIPPVTCPAPPPGCNYQGGDSCSCGVLLCQSPTAPAPIVTPLELIIEADDNGFYPSNTLEVSKDAKVKLTFMVRDTGVYFGGLDFRSPKFTTPSVKPGGSSSVEFTADTSFTITSYWPASGVKKADLMIEVK